MTDQPHPTDITVGRNVRMARRAKGVTQEALADALGITFQQVQKYERGANRVSASKLLDIARALDLPVSQFFRGLEGAEGESQATELDAFAMAPGGLELAAIYTALPEPMRRSLLNVAKALNDLRPGFGKSTIPEALRGMTLATISQAEAARLTELATH